MHNNNVSNHHLIKAIMLSILFIYFNHYHDFKTLGFIYFVGLKMIGSHWSMRPNVEFRIELPKTNPSLAKSHFQQETCGYAQKPPPTMIKGVSSTSIWQGSPLL